MTRKSAKHSSHRALGADGERLSLGTKAALPTAEAALYIGFARGTLKNWRVAGVGPPYVRIGSKIVYMVEDLDDFLRAHRID